MGKNKFRREIKNSDLGYSAWSLLESKWSFKLANGYLSLDLREGGGAEISGESYASLVSAWRRCSLRVSPAGYRLSRWNEPPALLRLPWPPLTQPLLLAPPPPLGTMPHSRLWTPPPLAPPLILVSNLMQKAVCSGKTKNYKVEAIWVWMLTLPLTWRMDSCKLFRLPVSQFCVYKMEIIFLLPCKVVIIVCGTHLKHITMGELF